MGIKWKKRKGKFDPSIVLARIQESVIVTSNNRVSYSGFTYFDSEPAIHSMLEFPDLLSREMKHRLIGTAISQAALKKDLTPDSLITEINKAYSIYKQSQIKPYILFVPLSITGTPLHQRLVLGADKITFYTGKLPSKYESRKNLIDKWREDYDHTPKDYMMTSIKTLARSPYDAVMGATNSIHYYRSILNLMFNASMEFGSGDWKPINRILAGGLYSLHTPSGSLAIENYYFDPECVLRDPYQISLNDYKTISRNFKYIVSQLTASKFGQTLIKAMTRFYGALDSRNHSNSMQQLWNTMESLSGQSESNCDKMIARICFLFKDRIYHKQILEHLRETRNSYVHSGEESATQRNNCFQLQYYFHHLILFYINHSLYFNSLEEANTFLDLPHDLNKLAQMKKNIEKAEYFFSQPPLN